MHILTIMQNELGDYHQGMGLICAFLLLTLSSAEVLAMLRVIATEAKYLPDFWKAESIACATDGYLWKDMIEERYPNINAHLNSNFILPETFVQKWFCALCVHVLPFESLFGFISLFFRDGHTFLFRFGVSLVDQFQERLLAAKSQAQIYALLRLDATVVLHAQTLPLVFFMHAHIFPHLLLSLSHYVVLYYSIHKYLLYSDM